MEELNYDNMMAVAKSYCQIIPALTPQTKHLLEAICTPELESVRKHADKVSSHYKEYRAYLYYEPWPLFIAVDERKKIATCILREEDRHPMTGELVKTGVHKHPVTGEIVDTLYMSEDFEFALHDGKVKIKQVWSTSIDPDSAGWKRCVELADKH